jgi:hypothetical protein
LLAADWFHNDQPLTPTAAMRNEALRETLVRTSMEATMGRGILLWLLGIPIPVIILLWLFFGH